jgi:hypothetical protein
MSEQELGNVAGKRFARVRVKAFWKAVLSFLTGHDDHLVSWNQARQELHVLGEASTQVKSVALDDIVGTVGRYEDFDRAFLPTHDSLSHRWQSIHQAHEDGIALPPIQLYQVGDAYFVVDGHHRVSVARARGIHYLEAQVIEVQTRVPVSDHLDVKELAIRGEYVRFLEQSHLDESRPDQCIEFTAPGGYDRLLALIGDRAPGLGGEDSSEHLPLAASEWYDDCYLPLVQVIREHHILDSFPGRTEADLFLWLVDHEAELRAQCGPEVDTERAARHLAERHGRHLLVRAARTMRDWLSHDACELVVPTGAKP